MLPLAPFAESILNENDPTRHSRITGWDTNNKAKGVLFAP